MTVAYVMSRFPKVTETFVLQEMVQLQHAGVGVEVYPLLREDAEVRHPEVGALEPHVRGAPWLSRAVIGSHWHFLRRRPGAYLRTFARALRAVVGSGNFTAGLLVFWPKVVHYARDMQQRDVRHVHAHFANHPALCAWIVHGLTDIPFSFTAHGSDLHVDQRGLAAKADAAAFVVTVSEYNRCFLASRCGADAAARIHVVHCGVDPTRFAPAPPSLPAERARLRIACVASLRAVKGHRHLLNACARLRDRDVPFYCTLVGAGPLQDTLQRQIADLGLGDVVRLRGALPAPEVAALLREADVAVLTSVMDRQGRREGIPVSLMEAMATGLPVIASRISGIPELVADGVSGVLTPPGDAAAIAAALESLWRDPGRRQRLGAAGRAHVQRHFDQRANAAALVRLIDRDTSAAPPVSAAARPSRPPSRSSR
ncbi:MAG: glycosyltransferase [Planctomycetota bacterium]